MSRPPPAALSRATIFVVFLTTAAPLLAIAPAFAGDRPPSPPLPSEDDSEPEPESVDDWEVDGQGRRLRVGFDTGTRWVAGGGLATGWAGAGDAIATGHVETGAFVRHLLDYPADDVAWKMTHAVLPTRLVLRGVDDVERLDLETTLYRGHFTRWTKHGWITVPTSPPKRIPFPLNVGLQGVVGGFATRPNDPGIAAELSIVHTDVVLDFWRARALGSYAQVSVGTSYDLQLLGSFAGTTGIVGVAHVISPFASVELAVHHEYERGRQAVDARVRGAWLWSSQAGWGPRAQAAASYEVIVIAVNDQPVSLYVDAAYRFEGLSSASAAHDLRATAGLRFGVPLD